MQRQRHVGLAHPSFA